MEQKNSTKENYAHICRSSYLVWIMGGLVGQHSQNYLSRLKEIAQQNHLLINFMDKNYHCACT